MEHGRQIGWGALRRALPDLYLILRAEPPDFPIVDATDAYLAATLVRRDEVSGRGIFEIFPDDPGDSEADGVTRLRQSLCTVVATRQPDTMPVQRYPVRTADGGFTVRYWSPRNSPVFDDDGQLVAILHRVEDVTAFVLLEEETQRQSGEVVRMEREILARQRELGEANHHLRFANERLSAVDAAKTAFFANVSHEFRTPLTLILGLVGEDTAGGLGLDARVGIERNARRLLHLVNRVLEFSRIGADGFEGAPEPTDLGVFTRDLVQSFEPLCQRAGLELRVETPPPEPARSLDRLLWESIVLNLVGNGFKYTVHGRIEVRLRTEGERVVLEVQDTGPGISADEVARLFERFRRVPGIVGRSHEGTGLGLTLVKLAAERMGGQVTVVSEVGVGTTFRVEVRAPRAATSEAPAPLRTFADYAEEGERWSAGAGVPAPRGEGPETILVADDNGDMRDHLARLLGAHWTVVLAADGAEALERVQTARPDLVVTDLSMPHVDGLELIRRLRSDPATATLPVIVLSARAGTDDVLSGIDTGADEYLVKPFSARELLARVRTQLLLRQERTRAERAANELAESRARLLEDVRRKNAELEAFAWSASHDLRAPLRAIDGFAQALVEDCAANLSPDGEAHLGRIRAAAQRMGRILDGLLSLSRVERASFKPAPVDVTRVVTTLGRSLLHAAPDAGVELVVHPGMVAHADRAMLEILYENLMGNAWKFSRGRPAPRVEVGVDERDGEWRWFVRDNGVGFDPTYVDRLFRPFSRLHREAEFPGTGIGLATVKRVVERHGGRAWAEGVPGVGTTIWWTLPPAAP